ncbi:hypothetical protein CMV_005768 [Castanea mollissima]|uniref:Cholesterol oxidase n=1 Tax=Castanea mollissima TaxID=60419 RepID=A0A8J4W1G2_9ROSI|nr:hypothetical protein CMV_005768 [Castanea mollissima]
MKIQAELEGRLGDGEEDGYDAVVVGSGYGGSVAACRMSIAGLKVCLIEKGRRWEAQDFPTDSFKIMSTVRMENRDLGIRFGPKDALFQVYEQNDSLAAVACGLGGGSLVNAGVMLPTPVCARRNPKWPKEWEGDWDHCEASAVAMLRTQSIPIKFHAAKVLGEIVDEQIENLFETSVKLSMNFDLEESMANSKTPQKMDSCLACGNCLAGCPYNAKSSTDKNYLVSAIQNAVLPTAYPHLLFKGITTYGWPTGYWFFHGTIDKIRHIIGGCNASSDPSYGVCNPSGQVFNPESSVMVHPGLYICDASLIPCSVGINPSFTIATAAEYVSKHLVQHVLKHKKVETAYQNPHSISNKNTKSGWRSMVMFKETMRGYVGGMPCTAYVKMKMNSQEQKGFSEWKSCISNCYPFLRGKVGGYVEFKAIEKDKLHIIDAKVSLCEVDYRAPYTVHTLYALSSSPCSFFWFKIYS